MIITCSISARISPDQTFALIRSFSSSNPAPVRQDTLKAVSIPGGRSIAIGKSAADRQELGDSPLGDAQFAILVTDERQGKGVGTELLRRLVDVARAEGVVELAADMRADNVAMRRAAEKVGFTIVPGPVEDVVHAEMRLG